MIDKSLIGEKKKKRINNKFSSGSAYKSIQSDGCKVLNSANICILPFLLYIKKEQISQKRKEQKEGRDRGTSEGRCLMFLPQNVFLLFLFFFLNFIYFFHDFLNYVVRAVEPTESHRDPPEN